MAQIKILQDIDAGLSRSPVSFGWHVIKKYRRDDGPRLSALVTYYGFLSLFPLLLAVLTGIQLFLKNHVTTRENIIQGIGHYFPVIGSDLESHIHSPHKTGLALVIALALTIYGAKGGADSLRDALNQIWKVPKDKQPGFPASMINSFKMIIWGGGGLVAAEILSNYAAGLNHSIVFRLISIVVSLLLITGVFYMFFRIVVASGQHHRQGLLTSAVTAAVGVEVLQAAGNYILTHELKNLSALYGTFAIVLGLLFWINLQVQVLLYAAEAGSLRADN